MAETSEGPGDSNAWTFGSKWTTLLLTLLVASFPIILVKFGPALVLRLGSTLGYYLRKKSAGRRAQILELVEADEQEFIAKGGQKSNSDGESENVVAGTARNGQKDAEWDGIVGFFHPFWYGISSFWHGYTDQN